MYISVTVIYHRKKFTRLPERKNIVYAVSRSIIIIDKSSKLLHRMKTEQVSNHEKSKIKQQEIACERTERGIKFQERWTDPLLRCVDRKYEDGTGHR
jgi:DNA polymerase III alpha subunit (gram-positive type)